MNDVMKNLFFDTCVYHQPGIDLIFAGNPRRVFPWLDALLKARGL